MKSKKYVIHLLVGLLIAFVIIWQRGLFAAESVADKVLIICDGFTVVAFIYLCLGALLWISSTGTMDIFSYALKRGVNALLPGRVFDDLGGYYEYKMSKQEKRKGFKEHSTLVIGFLFLVVSIVLTMVWYSVAQ